jgi:hypothetical protein
MSKLYEIIGLRETVKKEEYENLKKDNKEILPEVYEIEKGFINPMIASSVLICRIKCLEDMMEKKCFKN